jgi:tetratricopeptide (TPR) repeat protein
VAVREKLVAGSPRPAGHQVDLLASCIALADLLQGLQENSEQATLLERALALTEQLAVEFPDRSSFVNRAPYLSIRGRIDLGMRLGDVSAAAAEELRQVGSRREAEAVFRRAEAAYRRAADFIQKNAGLEHDWDWDLVNCYAGLAAIYEKAGRVSEAEQAFRQQLVALEKIATKGPTPGLVDADIYFCLRQGACHTAIAQCLRVTEQHPKAAEEYRKAAEQYSRGLALSTGTKKVLRLPTVGIVADGVLADLLNDQAWLLATCPYPEVREPAQAVELAVKAVDARPKVGGYWNTLGVARYRAGHWSDAVAALEKSVQLGNGGDAFDGFFLAMAHWQLGDKDQARDCYDKAAAWMENNKRSIERSIGLKDELQRFRAGAAALLKVEDQQKLKPN